MVAQKIILAIDWLSLKLVDSVRLKFPITGPSFYTEFSFSNPGIRLWRQSAMPSYPSLSLSLLRIWAHARSHTDLPHICVISKFTYISYALTLSLLNTHEHTLALTRTFQTSFHGLNALQTFARFTDDDDDDYDDDNNDNNDYDDVSMLTDAKKVPTVEGCGYQILSE